MFENVYTNKSAKSEEKRVPIIIDMLFEYYMSHFEKLPVIYAKNLNEDGKEICSCGYIPGMTDNSQ